MSDKVYVVDAEMRVLFPGDGAYSWSVEDAPAIGAEGSEGLPVAAHLPVGPYVLTLAKAPLDGIPYWEVRPRETADTWYVIQYVVDGEVKLVDVRTSVPSVLTSEENGHLFEVRVVSAEADWYAADKRAKDLRASTR